MEEERDLQEEQHPPYLLMKTNHFAKRHSEEGRVAVVVVERKEGDETHTSVVVFVLWAVAESVDTAFASAASGVVVAFVGGKSEGLAAAAAAAADAAKVDEDHFETFLDFDFDYFHQIDDLHFLVLGKTHHC